MYPFWGANRAEYCGLPGFELDCKNNIPTITMALAKYRILQINTQQQAITVARDDLWNGMCPAGLVNTTLNFELFCYDFGHRNLTLFYGCNFSSGNVPWFTSQYNCSTNGTNVSVYCVSRSSASGPYYQNCNGSVVVPVFENAAQALDANMTTIGGAVDAGFELFWSPINDQCITCMESGGVCGCNWKQSEFTCFCYDQPNQDACPTRPEIKQQQNQEEPYVGVNIGTDISNFLSPSDLVAFLQVQKITHVRLYDADPDILKALAKTKIPVIISVPNNQLLAIYSFRFSSLLTSVHVLL
ncbi:Glucan endo-1,3-beta-glucosidase 1 [Camellia lanceoleosa]|uniref:Glucan endo-1,3-beta-glucosidase 1 n=1 Tax=Camellia lanceoleosa TaxID=1840588 RepID=A0ACC0J6B3_9ERIC|nr:Glucan endo-1,3-beta-glucosidase 1 [Camellia lanceoleosa]